MSEYIQTVGRMPGAANNLWSRSLGSPALGTANAVHAAVSDNGNTQVVTTAITGPDSPRNITATPGGTTGNITATQVTISGTNIEGQPITEALPAFTAAANTAVAGLKAFATVTSISIPACGNGVTTAIGLGTKLGAHRRGSRDTILNAYLNGVREATRPTVAFDATNIENNTVILNSALNGTPVILDSYDAV